MYIYTRLLYPYTYTYTYTYKYTYIHIYIFIYIDINIDICINIYIYVCNTYIRIHVYVSTHTHTHICIHLFIHTCVSQRLGAMLRMTRCIKAKSTSSRISKRANAFTIFATACGSNDSTSRVSRPLLPRTKSSCPPAAVLAKILISQL